MQMLGGREGGGGGRRRGRRRRRAAPRRRAQRAARRARGAGAAAGARSRAPASTTWTTTSRSESRRDERPDRAVTPAPGRRLRVRRPLRAARRRCTPTCRRRPAAEGPDARAVARRRGRQLPERVAAVLAAQVQAVAAIRSRPTSRPRSGCNAEGRRLRVLAMRQRIALGVPAAQIENLQRVLDSFETYCTVTQSVRAAIPVTGEVVDSLGARLSRLRAGRRRGGWRRPSRRSRALRRASAAG